MRKLLVLCLLLIGLVTQAQNRNEQAVLERTYLLQQTVFGTKDSLVLHDLFARKTTYGHSGGKVENRQEAIRNISLNKSVYSDTSIADVAVLVYQNVAIVRMTFRATETKTNARQSPLYLGLIFTWVIEKGKWRLLARQAFKL